MRAGFCAESPATTMSMALGRFISCLMAWMNRRRLSGQIGKELFFS